MCPLSYNQNGFMATHALGNMVYSSTWCTHANAHDVQQDVWAATKLLWL